VRLKHEAVEESSNPCSFAAPSSASQPTGQYGQIKHGKIISLIS